MAGAKSVSAMGDFAEATWPWVRKSPGSDVHEEPISHDTIGRLLQRLKPDIFEGLLTAYAEVRTRHLNGAHQIALDGKVLDGTARRDLRNRKLADGGEQPFTTVSVLSVETGLVMACNTSEDPGAERACVEAVLGAFDLRGTLVSVDAGNSHPKFARAILCPADGSGGGDYLSLPHRVARVVELTRGETTDGGLPGAVVGLRARWPGLRSVIEVERVRGTRNHRVDEAGYRRAARHRVFFLSSRRLNAREALRHVRAHWHVENKLHWVLDVNYGEDASRARSGYLAQNLATLRRASSNMLAAITGSTARRRYQMKFALDESWRDLVWGLRA